MGNHTLNKLLIFLLLWCFLGITITANDQEAYTLPHAGIYSVGTHGTYNIDEKSIPQFRQLGDIFTYNGNRLPAKQPGMFLFGGVAYRFLTFFGISYSDNYLLASSLVTFFTTTLFAALGIFLFFLIVRSCWNYQLIPSLLAAVTYGFGTFHFAYAGMPHHDLMACTLLLGALYFFEVYYRNSKSVFPLITSGFLCGLIPFMSMLPSIAALCLSLYVFLQLGEWKDRITFPIAVMIGFTPLLIYNYIYFDNPLIQANVAGNWDDTLFQPSWDFFLNHLQQYFGFGGVSLLLYAPAVPIAALSLATQWKKRRRYVVFCSCFAVLHFTFILNIEAVGYCQFGPRFLFPLLPLFCLFLPDVYAASNKPSIEGFLKWLAILSLPYSVVVNFIGAIGGTMYCDIEHFALFPYLNNLKDNPLEHLFLLQYLWIPILLLGFVLLVSYVFYPRAERLIFST